MAAQRRLLGERDQPCRGDRAVDRVVPAHERLERADPPVVQVDDRLEHE